MYMQSMIYIGYRLEIECNNCNLIIFISKKYVKMLILLQQRVVNGIGF